jgi:hypothetical protein
MNEIAHKYKNDGETMETAYIRFMADMIEVLVRDGLEIPSHMPDRSLIMGRVNGKGEYMAVVVDKTDPAEWKIVTCIFEPNGPKFRKNLVKYGLKKFERSEQSGEISEGEMGELYDSVNSYLESQGLNPI